jgi:hypothetical protein
MTLMQEMSQRALDLGVPLSVHFDVTYRCNELRSLLSGS